MEEAPEGELHLSAEEAGILRHDALQQAEWAREARLGITTPSQPQSSNAIRSAVEVFSLKHLDLSINSVT